MNKLFIAIYFCIFSFSFSQSSSTRVMTYNIRYANNNPGEEWILRRDNVAEMIRFHNPQIFGIQEALEEQVDFLSSQFPNYQFIGVGREDGEKGGEFSPLFISNKFTIEDFGTFWLSETPDTSSVGWDASYKRIATWAIIRNVISDESLFIMNTHLDHQGKLAREKSVLLLMNKMNIYSKELPIILMGDFNFTKESNPYQTIQKHGLVMDSEFKAEFNYGTSDTFNGFNSTDDLKEKIDFIFVSKNIDVIHHAIIGDKFNDKYPSDHMPVIIDFSLN